MSGEDKPLENKEIKDKYNEENSEIIFHYQRGERQGQKRASPSELLDKAYKRPGLIRSMAGNRGNFFLLISIVLISIMFILSLRHSRGQEQTEFNLGQNTVTLSVSQEESVVFLSIGKVARPRRTPYTGPVDISASPIMPMGTGEMSFVTQRVFFGDNSPEVFHLSLPFEGNEFVVILRTENETVTHTVRKRP